MARPPAWDSWRRWFSRRRRRFPRRARFPRRFGLLQRRPPPRRRDDPRPPLGFRRRFFPAAFAGAGVSGAVALACRSAAQRFLCAADMRQPAARLTMRLDASPTATVTVLSKPRGPVMRTRTSPRKGSAAIQASNGCARRWPAASTAGSMRSRRAAETPLAGECGQGGFSGRFPARRGNLENRRFRWFFCTDTEEVPPSDNRDRYVVGGVRRHLGSSFRISRRRSGNLHKVS